MLHLELDLSDPRLDGIPTQSGSLPLVYCSRCALAWGTLPAADARALANKQFRKTLSRLAR